MSHGSLYLEFEHAQPIGRARVQRRWARLYPGLQPDRWYKVLSVGRNEHGFFLADDRQPRYVARSHFEAET